MQTTEEKASAIASVLFLLTDHYRMIKAGRIGSCIHYERTPEGLPWRPPIMEEFDGWPVEEVIRWCNYQKAISRKYRLYQIGLALAELERERGELAKAVWYSFVEIPKPNWYEPENIERRTNEGLLFMAGLKMLDGDIRWFDGPKPKTRSEQLRELLDEGVTSPKTLAVRLGCSVSHAKKLKAAVVVRSGRATSAVGIDL